MTKNIFIILMLFTINLFGQDTTVTWIKNIDTLNFQMCFNKRKIPKDFRKHIGISGLRQIANPDKKYNTGCVASLGRPFMRLNWIAVDKQNHYIISISHGGYSSGTNYYYLDIGNKKTNVNRVFFKHGNRDLSFVATTTKIKNGQFEFLPYNDPNDY